MLLLHNYDGSVSYVWLRLWCLLLLYSNLEAIKLSRLPLLYSAGIVAKHRTMRVPDTE